MNVPFSPPDITSVEIEEVISALRSGWITTGPRTKQLEAQVAARCGVSHAVCLNSQTACAETALRILGIGPGDEVVTTAYTYTATASVVCHVGAKLVLVDTQPDCLEMDYDALERAITPATKAVIPVDLAGIPCDYDRIFEIVQRKKALFTPASPIQAALGRVAVLADTAHAFGAEYCGRPAGSVADFSAFSFHAVKNLTTAEGGALTWRDIPGIDGSEIYRTAQLLSLHGQSKNALEKDQLGAWEYDVLGTWYKCNMTDICAAIGLGQMQRYDAMLARRREIAARYDAALRPLGVLTLPHDTAQHTSSVHLYMTRIPGITPEQRNEIIGRMASRGVACNVHYKPLPLLTAYRELGFDIADFPNAYAHFANEVTLPLHTCLTDGQVDYVIRSYTDVLHEYGL